MRRKNFPLVALPILPFLCAAPLARAEDTPAKQEYEVKIARKIDVGTKYALTADGALVRQVKLTAGGQSEQQPDQGFGIHVEGTVEVLALDSIGEEAKVACTVEKCMRITSKGETEIVPKGQVILAEGKGKDTHFSLKDGPERPKE